MAWIESHQSLRTHRKTGRLARALGLAKVAAIGHLHCLWWWCMDNAPDGDLSAIDPEDIADGAEWDADPREFLDALVYAGFVDRDGAALVVHGWHDYAGKLIEKRQADAARKRAARQRQDDPPPSGARSGYVPRTSDGHPEDGARTVPNRTVPNPTKPVDVSGSTHTSPPPAARAGVRAVPKPSTLDRQQRDRFERWYAAYPVHKARPDAERAWRKLDPDDALTARLVADAAARRADWQWDKGHIPYPATYLNQRGWEDDITPPAPGRGGNGHAPSNAAAKFQRTIVALQGIGGGYGPADIPDEPREARGGALGRGHA